MDISEFPLPHFPPHLMGPLPHPSLHSLLKVYGLCNAVIGVDGRKPMLGDGFGGSWDLGGRAGPELLRGRNLRDVTVGDLAVG